MANLKSSETEVASLKVAVVQFAPLLGNKEANVNQLVDLLPGVDASIIVLPELASSGYAFAGYDEALLCAETITDSSFIRFLTSMAQSKNCHIVSGFNERDGSALFNTSVLVGPDGLIGRYRKLHLFWNEADVFQQGNMGLPVFEVAGIRIGMLVCFDWMFPEVWRIMALKGADLVAHPSNLVLPYCQQAVAVHALCNRMYVATANRIGTERSLTFTGGSQVVSPYGEKLLMAPVDAVFTGSCLVESAISRNKNITPRNSLADSRRPECYGELLTG